MDLVTFTGKILNEKIHFLCIVKYILTLMSILNKEEFAYTCQKALTRNDMKELFTNCKKTGPQGTC